MKFKFGSIVTFASHGKWGEVEGIVVGFKIKRSRRAAQLNRQMRLITKKNVKYAQEAQTLAVISDLKNRMTWKVPVEDCKFIRNATKKKFEEAKDLVNLISKSRSDYKVRMQNENIGKLAEHNLTGLRKGQVIKIHFKEGWQEKRFSHITSSGKVAFLSSSAKSGVRYAWPHHVRVVK